MHIFLRVFTILLALSFYDFYAQELPDPLTPTGRVTYGNHQHTSRDAIFFSETDNNGNLIVAGYTEHDFSFSDIKIMSFNKNLKLNWSDELSWDGISYDYPLDLMIDKEDHIWVISKNLETMSKANFIVARYTPEGSKLWEYKSPEPIETSFLNMNQDHYFFDNEGYLNFTHLDGRDDIPHSVFFRISPQGSIKDKYTINPRVSRLSHLGLTYQGISVRYDHETYEESIFFENFNKDERLAKELDLTDHLIYRLRNSFNNEKTEAFTDSDGNYTLVGVGNFHDDTGFQHKGYVLISFTAEGELNFFKDDDGSTDKYVLGSKLVAENEILVVSNSQPITEENKEPLLTLEKFSNTGELISSKRSSSVTANMINMLEDRILVRALNGDLVVLDYDLNEISRIEVESIDEIFNPNGLFASGTSIYLVGTSTAPKYEGSDFYAEENFYLRKFEHKSLAETFIFNGEGTSKFYNYHMVQQDNGDIIVSGEEFLGPHSLQAYGSKAPHFKKTIRYNKDLEYQDEMEVDREFDLWEKPPHIFRAENGDQYLYEINEERSKVSCFVNGQIKWTRKLDFSNDSYMEAGYNNKVDKKGNFVITSSRYNSYAGSIHKISPENEYNYIETGGSIQNHAILSNNWIFTYFKDYSIKVYSEDLELISSEQYTQDYFLSELYPNLIEKNNSILLNVRHRKLVMVFDQFGKYKDRFRLEGLLHPSVSFFDENDVLHSFHTVGNGIYLAHGHNWSRLAISQYSEIVKDYIGEMPTGDSDGDGISDLFDQCPETPLGTIVNSKGCARLDLPEDNFSLRTKDETCAGKENGMLEVKVKEYHDYVLHLNGEEYQFTQGMSFEKLTPGTYELCIQVINEDHTKRCFEFTIGSGKTLQAQSNLLGRSMSIHISEGTGPFQVKINDNFYGSFQTNEFEIPVNFNDEIEITSSLNCEGIVTAYAANGNNVLKLKSNPVKDIAEIELPATKQNNISVAVYNNSGQVIISKNYTSKESTSLKINMSSLPRGVYIAQIRLDKMYTLKIIKK